MSFPKPIQLPDEVYQARRARSKAVVRIALWGIAVRLFIVVFELTGYFFFGSSSLLLDSLSTLADVVSSVFLVIFVKLAERPPDVNHPFGHGRYEPLAGLQLGIFLTIAGVGMVFHEISHLISPEGEYSINSHVWLFPFVSVLLLELSYRRMTAIAKRENSTALAAEAIHFRVDSLNSLLAFGALLLASFIPESSWIYDRLGAVAIAMFMIFMGLYAAKKNLNQILDRVPEEGFFDIVRKAALAVDGVRDTEKVRIQYSGPSAHVDIDIEVDPELSVEKAHTISQHVRSEIQKAWPQVQDVVVHIEPYYMGDHT